MRVTYIDGEVIATVEQVCPYGGSGTRLKEPYYRLRLPGDVRAPGLASYSEHEMEPA